MEEFLKSLALLVTGALISFIATEVPRRRAVEENRKLEGEREYRAEQRERETALWNLEFSKFQDLERLLNEVVHTAIFPNKDKGPAEELRRKLWQTMEQLYAGFPNYEDLAHDIKRLESIYERAILRQNADDLIDLRNQCIYIIKNCRTALAIGLPKVAVEGNQIVSRTRLPPE